MDSIELIKMLESSIGRHNVDDCSYGVALRILTQKYNELKDENVILKKKLLECKDR